MNEARITESDLKSIAVLRFQSNLVYQGNYQVVLGSIFYRVQFTRSSK